MFKNKGTRVVAACMFAAACVATGLLFRQRPVAMHAAAPAGAASVKAKVPARSKTAALLPMPGPIQKPQAAPATTGSAAPGEETGVEQTITLPNGVAARLFAGRPSYPASAPVDTHLELYDADGEPLVGRRDLDAMIIDPTSGETPPQRASFAEDEAQPGRYDLTVSIPSSWKRAAVLLQVSETGDIGQPGQSQLVQVNVDHSGQAALIGATAGSFAQDGAHVVVLASAEAGGHATLAAELRDGEGTSFGRVSTNAELQPGGNQVELRFAQLDGDSPSGSHAFYLVDLQLDFDGQPTDFRSSPVPVSFLR